MSAVGASFYNILVLIRGMEFSILKNFKRHFPNARLPLIIARIHKTWKIMKFLRIIYTYDLTRQLPININSRFRIYESTISSMADQNIDPGTKCSSLFLTKMMEIRHKTKWKIKNAKSERHGT